MTYEAKKHHNDADRDWVIRIHHDGSFVSIGAANSVHEAELIVECINAVIRWQDEPMQPEDAMVLIKRLFQ